ncbi:MAG: TolC family protein [Kiritimatiellia bacterium]
MLRPPALRPPAALALLLLLAAGCASFEPVSARREHTNAFTNTLARLAGSELPTPLSLDGCVRVAMSNNYAIRQADLRRELNRIGKSVAFTAFLPTVAASAGYRSYAKEPGTADQAFSHAAIDVSLPIFMPSSWCLFAAQRQRLAISSVAAFYVRQGIVLQTSVDYYNCLIQQDTIAALESQLQAARETAERVRALAGEGLVTQWESGQAAHMADVRTVALEQARRQLGVARGELLTDMGLSPDAPLRLAGAPPRPAPLAGSTADLVLKALELHPELAMADRQVIVSQQEVRQAFTAFLPTLSLFSTRTWTGDDLANQSANWLTGLSGVWTLFNGLANVAQYKAAKVIRTSTELAREQTFLTIMIQVISSEAALRNAQEAESLYRSAFGVAEARFADYEAKAREGLLPLSDALDARSEMDFAQVALVRSRYQVNIAQAGLELAMGLTAVPAEKTEPKNGKP